MTRERETEEWLDESQSVVQINELKLDKECIRLPGQYLKFAHLAVDLRRDLDEAKAELEVVEAEMSKKVRDQPNLFGLDKVTEKACEAAVIASKRYKEAAERLREVKHHAELAQAVVNAMEHKKRSLTLLVELHGMGYFAAPKISEKGREAVENMTKRAVRRNRFED